MGRILQNFLLFFSFLGLTLAGPQLNGGSSYFRTTPATPLECACDAAITKVVIQEVNRTVMVPEFAPYDKHFARLTPGFVDVPTFMDGAVEEILEVEYVEKNVSAVNVEYKWVEVRKRMPLFNKTTLQIDQYEMEPVDYTNQQVKMETVTIKETNIQEQEEEIEETIVEEKETVLKFETIEYEDFKMEVPEVVYQDVVEYVEQIEYKPVDVYVWQVELIDEEFVQKDVQDKGTATPVEVDQVTIEKKAVKIPRLKYNYRDVLIHDPVEIIQTPVAVPEFYNQTYKVPIIQMKMIPVPEYRDVPVEVPTYKRVTCSLPPDPSENFVPSNCSCSACQPCTVCPTADSSSSASSSAGSTSSSSSSSSQSPTPAQKYKRQSFRPFRPSPLVQVAVQRPTRNIQHKPDLDHTWTSGAGAGQFKFQSPSYSRVQSSNGHGRL